MARLYVICAVAEILVAVAALLPFRRTAMAPVLSGRTLPDQWERKACAREGKLANLGLGAIN